jgi:hypothetical protein
MHADCGALAQIPGEGMAAFDDNAKLRVLSSLPYKEQAISFLNAFWARDPVQFGQNAEAREEM